MSDKTINIVLITFIFTLISIGIYIHNNKVKVVKCNHLKYNKDLIWMDGVLNSQDTVLRYFEDGSRLEFYPSPFKNYKK